MKRMMMVRMMCGVVAVGTLGACSREAARPPVAEDAVPEVFVSIPPSGTPIPIPEARELSSGTDLVVEGKVMGVKTPFATGRSVFVVGDDATIASCDERGDDHCPTPWDVCCEDRQAVRRGTATIQVLAADGTVLKQGLKGVNGLRELSRVTVKGTIAPESTPDAMIVNAKAIYVASDT